MKINRTIGLGYSYRSSGGGRVSISHSVSQSVIHRQPSMIAACHPKVNPLRLLFALLVILEVSTNAQPSAFYVNEFNHQHRVVQWFRDLDVENFKKSY